VNDWLNINKVTLNVNETKAMWIIGKEDMNGIKMDGKVLEILLLHRWPLKRGVVTMFLFLLFCV